MIYINLLNQWKKAASKNPSDPGNMLRVDLVLEELKRQIQLVKGTLRHIHQFVTDIEHKAKPEKNDIFSQMLKNYFPSGSDIQQDPAESSITPEDRYGIVKNKTAKEYESDLTKLILTIENLRDNKRSTTAVNELCEAACKLNDLCMPPKSILSKKYRSDWVKVLNSTYLLDKRVNFTGDIGTREDC